MGRDPLAPRNRVPESHGTQSQVGVFPERPREALIEAAGLCQSGTSVGHIGGDPQSAGEGQRAPLGWDPKDPAPVGDVVTFLFSDLARGISGELIHVDGGFHAMGTDPL